MTIKQICNVLYDNQKVEIYEDRHSYEPIAWGSARQFRNNNDKYADAEVDVVVPSGKTILIYLV